MSKDNNGRSSPPHTFDFNLPARLTPPPSPGLPRPSLESPVKRSFESHHRNFNGLRLNPVIREDLDDESASFHTAVTNSPQLPRSASHISHKQSASASSRSPRAALHSPGLRPHPASPLSSPRYGRFPGSDEPESPTSPRGRSRNVSNATSKSDIESFPMSNSLAPGQLSPTEPLRPMTASSRLRGQTTNTPPSLQHRVLRTATSIPDYAPYRGGTRGMYNSTYRPDRGAGTRESQQSTARRYDPARLNESVRTSTRSGVTIASSTYLETTGTERSSVLTKSDSASEFRMSLSHSPGPDELPLSHSPDPDEAEESMSVEDCIGMYEEGFHDDPPAPEATQDIEAADGTDLTDEGYVSQTTLARTPSSQESSSSNPAGGHKHTLSFEEGTEQQLSPKNDPEVQNPMDTLSLPSIPKPHHTRSSTQIIAGRTSAAPSQESDFVPASIPRDRYGFKKASQNVKVVEYDVWNFYYIEYLERRRKKWVQMMKQSNLPSESPTVFPPKNDKVKRFVRKGIPPEWRGAAWFWYAGGPERKAENPTLYKDLCKQVQEGQLSDSDREHIERDLHRTFPDNIRFRPEVSSTQSAIDSASNRSNSPEAGDTSILRALRRVLQAFAVHNPSIGYCQSLNFLAGLLLLFLDEDEEKAFILLDVITTQHLPGTHGKVLESNIDIGVLMSCIKESMPQIWAKIDDTDEGASHITTTAARLPTVSLALTSWFMSIFVSNLPIETVLRVWDAFFYEGSKTLFRIALAIFKLGEAQIRAINDPMEIFQIVQTIPRKLIDANALMEACYKKRNGFGHLSQETIDARRAERRRLHAEDVARLTGQPIPTDAGVERKVSALRRVASRSRMKRSFSRKRS